MVEVVAVSGIYNRTLTHTKEMKYLAFSRHRYFVVIQMVAVKKTDLTTATPTKLF